MVQVKEIRRFLVRNQEIHEEHETSLLLNPLRESPSSWQPFCRAGQVSSNVHCFGKNFLFPETMPLPPPIM